MSDFQLFIKENKILKKDIAAYLGVSNAFITQLCDGSKRIPPQKLALIKANDKGWDISMLIGEDTQSVGENNSGVVINGGGNHGSIDNSHYCSDSPDVLRAQVELLEERIQEKEERLKEKDAQIKEKDAQIKEKDAQIKQLLDIIQGLKK